MSDELRRERTSFSLTEGGPAYRLMVRLRRHLPSRLARVWWLPLFVWLPLVVGEAVRLALGFSLDPTLLDLSIHVRLLVTLPLFLASEPLLDQTVKSSISSLYKGKFCDRAALDGILDRAERLRDSSWVEAGLFALGLFGGLLVFVHVFGTTGWVHGGAPVGFWSFPRLWYAVIALPIFQFVMFRWLWRWLIWIYVLARLSRLPLVLLATHPDYAAGLTALARPVTGFCGFVLAISALLSGAWSTQVLAHRTSLTGLLPELVAFLLIALFVAVGPLLLFSGQLFRNRRRTLAQYGDFARSYMQRFHDKWLEPPLESTEPLGTPDIQSLNDLGSAFQVISKTRVFVFGQRTIFTVWFAGILPMLPLFASALTFEALLKQIVRTVLSGVPL